MSSDFRDVRFLINEGRVVMRDLEISKLYNFAELMNYVFN